MEKHKQNKGITLIALVITIIVMLILVSVTITVAVNGGLFSYAKKAHDDTIAKRNEEQEYATLKDNMTTEDLIFKYATPQYSEDLLDEDGVLKQTVKYTDANNETAIIPKGYNIVTEEVDGEENVLNDITAGLVIEDKYGNQFVWIPVPEKNMIVGTISTPYEYKPTTTASYSEPTVVSGDTQTNLNTYYGTKVGSTEPYFTLETDFAYEEHYKEMVESVNQYGGFYIGRYETTIDSSNNIGSKANTTVLTPRQKISDTDNSYRWWGLYYAQRHANVSGNDNSVQTNMIWGQQWDKMIEYFTGKGISIDAIDLTNKYNNPQTGVVASGQAEYPPKPGGGETATIKDKIYNIYDLRMNASEVTAEAMNSNFRVRRGGKYNSNESASFRTNVNMSGTSTNFCTRLTLYIK